LPRASFFLLAGSVNDVPEHLLTIYPVCTRGLPRCLHFPAAPLPPGFVFLFVGKQFWRKKPVQRLGGIGTQTIIRHEGVLVRAIHHFRV
jgi:hypothetical protein